MSFFGEARDLYSATGDGRGKKGVFFYEPFVFVCIPKGDPPVKDEECP